jgi:hypothetical protein
MLTFVAHLSLIYTNSLTTCIAILGEHAVEAGQTVRSPFPHYVPLTSQVPITFKAGKMFHMPGSSFCFGTLIGENNLVTRGASWLSRLSVVSAAIELPILVKVDQIYEEFLADGAAEAGGVPYSGGSSPRCCNADVTPQYRVSATFTCCRGLKSYWQLLHRAATQCIAFSLGRKQSEFFFLILRETIAIPDFIIVWGELVQELLDAILLSHRVYIRHLVIRQGREIQVHLIRLKPGRYPRVLLQSTPRVII